MPVQQYTNAPATAPSAGISSGATSITVASASGYPTIAPYRIRITEGALNEILEVTAGAGTSTWTVTRAVEALEGAQVARTFTTAATVEHVLTGASLVMAVNERLTFTNFKSIFGSTLVRGHIPNAAQLTTRAIAGAYNWPSTITALAPATTSLATQLSGITAGTQYRILPGVYREALPSLTVANLRLYGLGDVAITGMDNWSSGTSNTWATAAAPNASNGSFVSSLPIPTLTVDGDSPPITSALLAAAEQVMVDGVMFNKVTAGNVLSAGQWMLDGSRHVVLRTANSLVTGHVIEVTTRQNWCTPGSGGTGLTLDGIYFYGAASGADSAPPIQQNGQANLTIRNCMLGFTHGLVIAGGGANGLQVVDNVFHNVGSIGIDSTSNNTLVAGNIGFNLGGAQNNYAGTLDQSGYDAQWGSGFCKLLCDSGVQRDNIVWNTGFVAYWQDILCTNGVIADNVLWDFRYVGIQIETSSTFKAYGNHVFQTLSSQFAATAGVGIYVSSGRDGDIGPDLDAGETPNVVMNIGTAYKLGWQITRTDLPPTGPSGTANRLSGGFKRVRLHDNVAILRKTGGQGAGGPDIAVQWSEISGSIAVGTATTTESSFTATYTVANSLLPGNLVTVTGCSVAGYNVTNATVVTATATNFTVTLGTSGLGAGTGAVVVTGAGSSLADASNTGWHQMIGFGNGAVSGAGAMTWADDFIFLSDLTGLTGQQSGGWFYNVTDWSTSKWDLGTDNDGRTHKSRMLTFAEQMKFLTMYGLPQVS